jgi:diguanylate cyclase (GGDEF)-like protein
MFDWLAPAVVSLLVGLAGGLVIGRAWSRRASAAGDGQAHQGKQQSGDVILNALASAASLLFSVEDKDRTMTRALQLLGEAAGVDRVYIFENHRDPDTGELLASQRHEWCREGVEALIDEPGMQNMSYDRLIPNWRAQFEAREPVMGRVGDMPPIERELFEPQQVQSILIVPIFLDGEFWGLIGFDDCSGPRRWERAEVNALQIAAGTIGAAVRNLRADQHLRRLADTDSLTGLSSRRAFLDRVSSMLEESIGAGQDLSLLTMDLDHFKQVNDAHGYPAGDEALVGFARVCRATLRGDDLVGRMGGEEFGAVLPGAGIDQARELAEKLRSAVESSPVQTRSGHVTLSLSIGVSSVSSGVRNLSDLLGQAEDALDAAKRGGRNRVEVAVQSS